MSREIKFRVWDTIGNKFMDVFEVNLLDTDYLNNPEYIIQQFTGYLDKDGKEIYEGDILIYNFSYQEAMESAAFGSGNLCYLEDVKFENGMFVWGNEPLVDGHKDLKIIGNIQENKELLEHFNEKL